MITWEGLQRLLYIFGLYQLAEVVDIPVEQIVRYHDAPSVLRYSASLIVQEKMSFLLEVIACLEGSYNEIGIRQWFKRERPQLGEKSPIGVLSSNWKPSDPEPQKVLELARWLVGGGAT